MKPSRELVLEKICAYWPDDVDKVISLLDTLENDDSSDEGLSRVQLAVLKLAHGNKRDLVKYIEIAIQDFRDVLAYAEYPQQMKANHLNHFNLAKEEQGESKAILKADRGQYEAWLKGSGYEIKSTC